MEPYPYQASLQDRFHPSIKVELVTDKTSYSTGDEIQITVIVTNEGPRDLMFPSNPDYSLQIIGPSGIDYSTLSQDVESEPVIIPASSHYKFEIDTWNQINTRGQQVSPEEYTIKVELTDIDSIDETSVRINQSFPMVELILVLVLVIISGVVIYYLKKRKRI